MSAAVQSVWAPDPAFVSDLRAMLDDCGPKVNGHDRAKIVIDACLEEGIVMRRQIKAVAFQLGFKESHIHKVLETNTGRSATGYLWKCENESGPYSRH